MRVALFAHRFPPAVGGAERYFEKLFRYHAAAGDAAEVWTTTAVELEAFWKNGKRELPAGREGGVRQFPIRRFPARRYLLKAASLVPFAPLQALALPCNPISPAMWQAVGNDAGPWGAVHATAFPYSFPISCARKLARKQNAAFLITPFLHLGDTSNPNDRTRRQYLQRPHRWLLREADRVFVMTGLERDAVLALGIPERKVVLQGLGVEPDECTGGDRDAARTGWNLKPGDFAVGHLANNSVEKGSVDLLHAVAAAKDANFRLILAGPEMPNFRAAWDRFPRKELVTRLGVLGESQKRDFFAGIDAFALPSRSDSFGLVLLEAWANRKPVVAYRAGGPGEIIRDSHDGFLAACGDVAGLTAAISRLAGSRELCDALGGAGFARSASEFRWADKLSLVRETTLEAAAEKRSAG